MNNSDAPNGAPCEHPAFTEFMAKHGSPTDTEIIEWLSRNYHHLCYAGPDMSGKNWLLHLLPTQTERGRRERFLTLREAVAAGIKNLENDI